jgi:hypothetical protein
MLTRDCLVYVLVSPEKEAARATGEEGRTGTWHCCPGYAVVLLAKKVRRDSAPPPGRRLGGDSAPPQGKKVRRDLGTGGQVPADREEGGSVFLGKKVGHRWGVHKEEFAGGVRVGGFC